MPCCCQAVGTGSDSGCCCQYVAQSYLITFAGVTNGTSTCTLANHSFCMCYQACGFYVGQVDNVEAGTGTFNGFIVWLVFDCDDPSTGTGSGTGTAAYSGTVRVTVWGYYENSTVLTQVATYELGRDSWNCLGNNTMYLSTYTGDCATWPATITVQKDPGYTSTCICSCGNYGGFAIGTAGFYSLIMGALTLGDCTYDCGCDVPETRICMTGPCSGAGSWYMGISRYGLLDGDYVIQYIDGDFTLDPIFTWKGPGSCNIAHANPGSAYPGAILRYSPIDEKFYAGWINTLSPTGGGYEEYPLSLWSARYSINAASFDVLGNNTLNYDGGTYTACVLPATIQINYYTDQATDLPCFGPYYRCDICGASPLSGGWTFTISGITGPTHSLMTNAPAIYCEGIPCEAYNGTYCLAGPHESGFGQCGWSTNGTDSDGVGSAPAPIIYNYSALAGSPYTGTPCGVIGSYVSTNVSSYMGISGGIVYVQIILSPAGNLLSPGASGACAQSLLYEIAASSFNCNGDNTLDLKCGRLVNIDSSFADIAICECTGIPPTITISPTTLCGSPPSSNCNCTPNTTYNPIATITGITNGAGTDGCDECECFADLKLCFVPLGASSDCTWECTFTLTTVSPVAACTTTALYALLTIGEEPYPEDVVIRIYTASGGTLLATYTTSASGFSCSTTGTALSYLSDINEATCIWGFATCELAMDGTCQTCYPCDAGSNGLYSIVINYDSVDYTFCVGGASCSSTSQEQTIQGTAGTGTGTADDGDEMYVVLEMGAAPANLVRVVVYYKPMGGSYIAIAVYNYLGDPDGFSCLGASNSLTLAANNADQCGEFVYEPPYTDALSAACYVEGGCSACSWFSQSTRGTYSLPTTAGYTYTIECWGAGAGGGFTDGFFSDFNNGGGGGAYSKKTWVSDGSSLTITIGAGGTRGGVLTSPTAGGDTSVNSLCLAKGGGITTGSDTGGPGGAAASGIGDTTYSGGSGGGCGSTNEGGGGGGSAGPFSNGNSGGTGDGSLPASSGGAAVVSGGAGGDGGLLAANGGDGGNGATPGGGGGGGDTSSGAYGGSGADGQVIITCT